MNFFYFGTDAKYQYPRLKEEGEKRGIEVDAGLSSQLMIDFRDGKFEPSVCGVPLSKYQMIWVANMISKREDWNSVFYFLKKNYQTFILGQAFSEPWFYKSTSFEYLLQIQNKIKFPQSVLIYNSQSLESLKDQIKYPVIIKKSESIKGLGVFKANSYKEILNFIEQCKADYYTGSYILREWIPNDGDYRIFTLGHQAIGAMKRVPAKGEFRSNIAQGAKGIAINLDQYPFLKNIAEQVSCLNRSEISGVDIMIHKETGIPYILELNDRPAFVGLEECTGINIAGKILDYCLEQYKNKTSPSSDFYHQKIGYGLAEKRPTLLRQDTDKILDESHSNSF